MCLKPVVPSDFMLEVHRDVSCIKLPVKWVPPQSQKLYCEGQCSRKNYLNVTTDVLRSVVTFKSRSAS